MIKAVLVNIDIGIVENIIMVSSLEEFVPEGYKLVELPKKNLEISEEDKILEEILKEIDPNYVIQYSERPIIIGVTKWNEEKGFYGDGVEF